MRYYYLLNNKTQKVYLKDVPKGTASRYEIYTLYGKSFEVGYLTARYTPNDIFAEADRAQRFATIGAGVIISILCIPLFFGLISVGLTGMCILTATQTYNNELIQAREFNKPINLEELR